MSRDTILSALIAVVGLGVLVWLVYNYGPLLVSGS